MLQPTILRDVNVYFNIHYLRSDVKFFETFCLNSADLKSSIFKISSKYTYIFLPCIAYKQGTYDTVALVALLMTAPQKWMKTKRRSLATHKCMLRLSANVRYSSAWISVHISVWLWMKLHSTATLLSCDVVFATATAFIYFSFVVFSLVGQTASLLWILKGKYARIVQWKDESKLKVDKVRPQHANS